MNANMSRKPIQTLTQTQTFDSKTHKVYKNLYFNTQKIPNYKLLGMS